MCSNQANFQNIHIKWWSKENMQQHITSFYNSDISLSHVDLIILYNMYLLLHVGLIFLYNPLPVDLKFLYYLKVWYFCITCRSVLLWSLAGSHSEPPAPSDTGAPEPCTAVGPSGPSRAACDQKKIPCNNEKIIIHLLAIHVHCTFT